MRRVVVHDKHFVISWKREIWIYDNAGSVVRRRKHLLRAFGLIVPRSFVFFVFPFDESHNVHYYNNNDDNNNEQNIFLYESKMP